ncbi:Chaperone J-domain-containing protein [Venustampulla echinocandica]|uniref:Chaperone J-domain-containing protein n=1 Tax=Venustampulla echinocandica TaxID=2656787 RepID=A0A370TVQ5_9HELO|nr:Chaperone J-domain-containing protein [Venustampulla echinocandica]RDL39613.1 Chaperone J-domain-containing protein [Venustampulla echinocandica]
MAPHKHKDDEEDLIDEEPPSIEPYTVLGVEKSATPNEIKAAYRKAALKHHPDKAPENLKDEAHSKFQEVAFAYAVLSDPTRRKRYDVTGSTSESVDIDGFSWSEFYSEQFRDVITSDAIEKFSKSYKGSDEEKDALLDAYTKSKGKWGRIYDSVMLSDPLEDEERFKAILNEAIAKGDIKSFSAYTDETAKSKEARMKRARKEGKEAMEYAKELGVEEKLFGKGKKGKKESSEDALAALIQNRQAGRNQFLDNLEAKYAGENKPKAKKGKKRGAQHEDEEEGMPSEEAFQAAAAKLKNGPGGGEGSSGRKSKRTKR